MAKPFATCLVAAFFAAFCLCKAPPKAWQQTIPNRQESLSADIPYTKPFRKASWYIHPHKRLKGYEATCSEIAHEARHCKKIKSGFEALKRSSERIHREMTVAKLRCNRAKNRNNHLFAFDVTRSCQDIPNFYINANDVQTPLQSYMVTQGPTGNTIADFWKAILHKNSSVIVTLVMPIENGKDKCASYWTIPEVQCEDWTITLQNETHVAKSLVIPTHQIVVRTFLAKNEDAKRIVKQVHYENWPDGKIPDLDLFVKLLDTVDSVVDDPHAPITVHCSAGIGRSGTFVAAHSLRKEIRHAKEHSQNKDPLLINIPKAIFLLRCQRTGLVASTAQYKIVYQTIAKEHTRRSKPFFLLSEALYTF